MAANAIKPVRCAIYTRKSTEHGLELEFNSLDAQRDACEAYIKSQASQGWKALPQHYDDPAYSGGNLERPALQKLLKDIDAGRIEVIVVYKIDRLTRSLADFAKLVEAFDAKSISFVAVTQQFNTTTSMGRLTLNVLLSFAQFRACKGGSFTEIGHGQFEVSRHFGVAVFASDLFDCVALCVGSLLDQQLLIAALDPGLAAKLKKRLQSAVLQRVENIVGDSAGHRVALATTITGRCCRRRLILCRSR